MPDYKLMIIESPNKVEKLSSILGAGWRVVASVGHICDLPKAAANGDIGVDLTTFTPKYMLSERGEQIVTRLRKLTKEASEVYLATDPDREGEAISWHLKENLKLGERYKRVTFQAITPGVVAASLDAPRRIDDAKVRSQEARRVLDRMVGYLVSPVISRKTNTALSAGRVQTPAVRLVCERERAIQTFVPTDHFGAKVQFGEWEAVWDTRPFVTADSPYVLDRGLADCAASCREFVVLNSETKPALENPPAPFRTSTLMQAASVSLGLSPGKTMELAQALFDAGHINYHRTDVQNMEDETIELVRAFSRAKGWPLADKPRKWKLIEGAQEGHEAIRPTDFGVENAGNNDDERNLYRMIRIRAIASQLAAAEYRVSTAIVTSRRDGREFHFKGSARTLVVQGWRALMPKDQTVEGDEAPASGNGRVPSLTVGSAINAESGEIVAHKTKAPDRYSQSSLIVKLEELGIGRPSAYGAVLANIMDRAYVAEKKTRLIPTPLGMKLVVTVIQSGFTFANYNFTSQLEQLLGRIEQGSAVYRDVMQRVYAKLQSELGPVEKQIAASAHPCPSCGKPLCRIPGKKNGTYFWGCSGYKDAGCKVAMDDVDGKPVARQIKPAAVSEYKCPVCERPLIHQVREGKWNFWGCSGYSAKPKCDKKFENRNGKPVFK